LLLYRTLWQNLEKPHPNTQYRIVSNRVPESGEDRGEERNKKDREFCLQLSNNVLQAGIDDDDILRSFRLGRWTETRGR